MSIKPSPDAAIAARLAVTKTALVLAHVRPDGDALGSIFALTLALRENARKADFYLDAPPPEKYRGLMPDGGLVQTHPEAFPYDTVFCLDCGSPDRVAVSDAWRERLKSAFVINIDHHPDNTAFGALNAVDPSACATAELVHDLLNAMPGWPLSKKVFDALLAGVLMDTGGFRFDNTSGRALRRAADLIDAGANYPAIVRELLIKRPEKIIRLESEILLNRLWKSPDGRYACFRMSAAELAANGLKKSDMEGVIDAARAIEGVEVVAMIYEDQGRFRASLRSDNPARPVGPIARAFGGGGHQLAAGCDVVAATVEEAEAKVRDRLAALFAE